MINFFTYDLEFWHSWVFYLTKHKPRIVEDNLVEPVNKMLKLLRKYNTSATFFTLATVAEKYPELIREIEEQGHEIACHGYSHRIIMPDARNEFEEDLQKALRIIRRVAKERIIGYRAPSWSLTKKSGWVIDVLKKNNMKYDSSLAPFRVGKSGKAPDMLNMKSRQKPYYIDSKLRTAKNGMLEFPVPSVMGVPIIGGFYHRLLPVMITKALMKRLNNKGIPANFWIHSSDYTKPPRVRGLPFSVELVRQYNIKKTMKKTEALLKRFKFDSIKNQIENYE